MDKTEQLKEIEFLWNTPEDIVLYFTKLHKEQERLETIYINWDDLQKVTQDVEFLLKSIVWRREDDLLVVKSRHGQDMRNLQVIFQGALR